MLSQCRRPRHALVALTALITIVCLTLGDSLVRYVRHLSDTLPSLDTSKLSPLQSVVILDRAGGELYRVFKGEDRTSVRSGEIPLRVKQAIIAAEDERFFGRGCIDSRALVRAAVANLWEYKSQGASTVTQQLVRNVFLKRTKTVERKAQEILLACRLEEQVSKEKILDLYLNRIPFGGVVYGVDAAARTFFGVAPQDLTIAQAAVLAALPQRPSYFSPYGNHLRTSIPSEYYERIRRGEITVQDLPPEVVTLGLVGIGIRTPNSIVTVDGRSNRIVQNMHRLGFVTEQEYLHAERELRSMRVRPRGRNFEAPHFVQWIRNTLNEKMAMEERWDWWVQEGLKVETTLDPKLQEVAEETVASMFPTIAEQSGAKNMALLAVGRKSREILAYVGNRDFFDDENAGQVDMVQAPRQPGSAFKPFVYAAAFVKGYTSSTMIDDAPIWIGGDRPRNYEGGFMGRITIKKALAASRNIPAIRAFLFAGGEEAVLALAAEAGAPSPKEFWEYRRAGGGSFTYGWPLAIGSAELPLFELVQAYATLANGGLFKPLKAITAVRDWKGSVLVKNRDYSEGKRVMDDAVADDLASILQDVESRPIGLWRDQLTIPGMEVGVKTGTSNLCFRRNTAGICTAYGVNNTWTVGFTDDLIVGVWVGNADNMPLTDAADGLTTAAPLWKEFILRARHLRNGGRASLQTKD